VSPRPADKPLVVNRCTVWFDEFDTLGVLHNARYAIHVERAVSLFFASVQSAADPADLHFLVKQYAVEFVRPFTRQLGELTVELWMERLGTTSAVFGFRCQSEAGAGEAGSGRCDTSSPEVEHARGTRTVVRVDPATGRPAPWSAAFRELFPEEG
jgi:acyl-CoA thioester hydrolase